MFKRYTSLLLILSFFLPVSFFWNPKEAHALASGLVPVGELGEDLVTDVSNTVSTLAAESKDFVLDPLSSFLAKQILRRITASIVNWINRGFEGSPAFVTDPAGFFADIGSQELGFIISGSGLDFLCSPFKLQVQLSFRLQGARRLPRTRCTLERIIGNIQGASVEGFISGDFRQGGWDAWRDLTTKNNPYRAYLDTLDAYDLKVAQRQGIAKIELDWGKGFLSFKDASGQIQTPGSVIENQLNNALGSDFRQLELADEIDEIVGALAGQLIKTALGGGGGLSGASKRNASGRIFTETIQAETAEQREARENAESRGQQLNTQTDEEKGRVELARINAGEEINVASRGQTRQITDAIIEGTAQTANNAVDGRIISNQGRYNPLAITQDAPSAWWSLTLNQGAVINRIVIYRRTDVGSGVTGFNLALGNFTVSLRNPDGTITSINPTIGTNNSTITIDNLPANLKADYIEIRRLTPGRLQLAEVEVYGVIPQAEDARAKCSDTRDNDYNGLIDDKDPSCAEVQS